MTAQDLVADSLSTTKDTKARVFISYSRKDIGFADRLDQALKERGFEPLIDRRDISAFKDWWTEVKTLIALADTLVFVISPNSVAATICNDELGFAVSLNKRLAPILLTHVSARDIPSPVRQLHWISFEHEDQFENSVAKLVTALETDIEWVRKHTELGEAARRWAAHGRRGSRGLLLRSPSLEEAEDWVASRPHGAPLPTEEVRTYITVSRRAAITRRNTLIAVLLAGLVVTLALAALAFWQRTIAEEQRDAAEFATGQASNERDHSNRALREAFGMANLIVSAAATDVAEIPGVKHETVRDLLTRALDLQAKVAPRELVDLQGAQTEAMTLDAAANALRNVGDTKQALATAEKASGLWEDIAWRRPSDTDIKSGMAAHFQVIGDIQMREGRVQDAIATYHKTLSILRGIVAKRPDSSDYLRQLGYALVHSAEAEQNNHDSAASRREVGEGLTIFCTLARKNSGDVAQNDLHNLLRFLTTDNVAAEQFAKRCRD